MKKILLIEDDPFMIDIYTTKLKEAGFLVHSSADGEDALRQVKNEKPDLILLDIVLPKLTDLEFLKEIKDLSQPQETPVIILSNSGQKAEIEKGLKMGAVKYFIKAHYTPSEVVEKIQQILS